MASQRSPLSGLLARVLIAALVLTSLPVPASAFARVDPLRGPIHADGLGSIRRLTDEAGTITDGYTYSAFGELLAHTGSDSQPYSFTGEPLDPNSGWQYHRARWMDPSVGRFLGMDPWDGSEFEPVTLHKYLYGNSDPLGLVDPSGETPSIAGSLTAISGLITVAIRALPPVGIAFGGGAAYWQRLAGLGRAAQLGGERILLLYQGLRPGFQYSPMYWVNGGRNNIDYFLALGPRLRVLLEMKHNLPWGHGPGLTTLVAQVRGGLASRAGEMVVWVYKLPIQRQINLLQGALGADYGRIQIHYGVRGLWDFLVQYFGRV